MLLSRHSRVEWLCQGSCRTWRRNVRRGKRQSVHALGAVCEMTWSGRVGSET